MASNGTGQTPIPPPLTATPGPGVVVNHIILTLPDGSQRMVEYGTAPADVIRSIGPRLLSAAVAVEIDGTIQDLMTPIRSGGAFRVLTQKDERSLDVLRHSAAHVMATAVRRIRAEAKIGFGPAIENGFYYDFEVTEPFTPKDLMAIEEEMARVAKEAFLFVREEVDKDEARRRFSSDPLKLERLEELGDNEIISTYSDGPFVDLCRGPHVPDTSQIRHFKLLSSAAAYWRGDERRQTLQRVYGTAWWTKADLESHLNRLEEARRRDHRTLGKQLDLFSVAPRVGAGLVLWHPRGATIRNQIEQYELDLVRRHGYEIVYTPHIVSERLFEISGHLESFRESMFGAMEVEGSAYRPKPMNCPGHICIYQSHLRSYRELPIRYAEFGTVYRYERSGVLHGMLRVRGFTQDDAHVFCTREQLDAEIARLLDLVHEMLDTFGYPYTIELATRPENALGDPDTWLWAEKMLAGVLHRRGQVYDIDPGGGAFYGPKLDFKLIDAIGRKWQGPTVQLDFNLPERFGLEYLGADNVRHRPFMLHRVLVGSMERFVGGLIEHYAGAFPVWLAPEQIRILPLTSDIVDRAREVVEQLATVGIRANLDERNETLNHRIRDAEMMKIPYMGVVGAREAADGTVALRMRGTGRKQENLSIEALTERILHETRVRALSGAGIERKS